MTLRNRGYLLRSASSHHHPAAVSALRTEVDQPVGGLHHVQVVFNHDHRVALVDKPVENSQQFSDVFEVETGGRFVKDVDGVTGGSRGARAGAQG